MNPRPYPSMQARILANVKKRLAPEWTGLHKHSDPRLHECWIWQGHPNARGYGTISIRTRVNDSQGNFLGMKPRCHLVHRFVLLVFRGIEINEVECASHQCSTKPCCNPWHIDASDHVENRADYYQRERFKRPVAA